VVNYLMRKVPAFAAMTLGILVSSLSWLVLTLGGSVPLVITALFLLAIGEVMLAPRLYEYCSRLAPPGQQGMFMGFAFLPVAIGYFIAGPLGGWLVRHFGEELHTPHRMWFVVTGVGLLTVALMIAYDRIVKPEARAAAAG